MADIQPYVISIPDSALEDLNTRLSLAKFPDELERSAWDLGAPLKDIKRLTQHWHRHYSWRDAERKLNELPHFTTSIKIPDKDGGKPFEPLKIHFIYQKSKNSNAIPLLFVHGWPGSFLEVTKILDPLTSPTDPSKQPSFDVVAISLPNFGFSQGPSRRGFAIEHYASVCNELMTTKLNYDQYVTQGGDWGYYITRAMSLLYPDQCKATHLNMDYGDAPTFSQNFLLALQHSLAPYTKEEKRGLERTKWFSEEGSAYRIQQSTKPQTLGYALADSPVALLAWVYEKLHDWTDDYPWTDDEVCTWMSVYWFSTAGPAASIRIYYEGVHDNAPFYDDDNNNNDDQNTTSSSTINKKPPKITRDRIGMYIPHVKIGLSHSPRDLRVLPKTWTHKQGEIVFDRTHPSGGHFFAWEKPQSLIEDVREMFGRERGGAFGIVKGRNGY